MTEPTTQSLRQATSAAAFEARYRAAVDPWDFQSSAYERDRYRSTLAALGKKHYRHAFEPGCSIGELTAMLAPICDRITATDISPTACRRAAQRCAQFPGVRIRCGDVAASAPPAGLDLIVLSEIAYYFDESTLATLARQLARSLSAAGELIAVHWLGTSKDHVLHGDTAHAVLLAALPLTHVVSHRYDRFRIDVWSKA